MQENIFVIAAVPPRVKVSWVGILRHLELCANW